MATPYYGDYGVVLPNSSVSLGASLEGAIDQKERQQVRADIAAKEKKAQDDENLAFINTLGLEDIGNNTVDVLTNNELAKVRNQLLEKATKGASEVELKYEAQKLMQPLIVGHTAAKNKFKQLNSNIAELGKTYTGANLAKAREIATVNFLKDYIDIDPTTNAPKGFKDPTVIPDKDYTSELLTFDNLPKWNTETGALGAYLKGLGKAKQGGDFSYTDKRGGVNKYGFDAEVSQFRELTTDPETGRVTGMKLKEENLGGLKLLPQQEFNTMIADPKARAAFAVQWSQEKNRLQQQGTEITPDIEGIAMRKFAYDLLDRSGGALEETYFKPREIQKAAPAPRINVSVNTGDREKSVAAITNPDSYATLLRNPLGKVPNTNVLGINEAFRVANAINAANKDLQIKPLYLFGVDTNALSESEKAEYKKVDPKIAQNFKEFVTIMGNKFNLSAFKAAPSVADKAQILANAINAYNKEKNINEEPFTADDLRNGAPLLVTEKVEEADKDGTITAKKITKILKPNSDNYNNTIDAGVVSYQKMAKDAKLPSTNFNLNEVIATANPRQGVKSTTKKGAKKQETAEEAYNRLMGKQ